MRSVLTMREILAMMENLDNAGVHASQEAINRLKSCVIALSAQVERQESHEVKDGRQR